MTDFFKTVEIAKFTVNQVQSYEDSLKYYRDLKNSLDTAREEGVEKGIEKGVEKVAVNAIKLGKSNEEIILLTGLTHIQIST